MTLWHQRLLKYFVRFLGGLAIFIIVGWFLFYNYYFKKDSLIKYVPEDALGYVTVRISPELINSQAFNKLNAILKIRSNAPDLQSDQFNGTVGNNLSLALILNQSGNFDYLLIADIKGKEKDIRDFLAYFQQIGWPTYFLENQTSNKSIFLAASSLDALNQAKETASKQKKSLADDVKMVFNLRKFPPNEFWGRAYFKADLFKNIKGDSLPELKAALLLLNIKPEDQYLGLKLVDNKLVVQSGEKAIDANIVSQNVSNLNKQAILSLRLKSFNSRWPNNLENLKNQDSQYYEKIARNLGHIEEIYNLNLDNDILPLLNEDAELVLLADNQYFINLKLNPGQDLAKFEEALKIFLANQSPVEQLKQMPDKTYIKQIILPIDKVTINEENIQGVDLKSFKYLDHEFIYVRWDNKLLLANSKIQLLNLIDDQISWNRWKTDGCLSCYSKDQYQNLYINLANFKQIKDLSADFVHLYLEDNVNTNKFWLILD